MNSLRAHRLPIVWMLFAFVLFNGLACSIGHGLMMGMDGAPEPGTPRNEAAPAVHAHADMQMDMAMPMQAAMDTGAKSSHDSLKSMFGACTFAGILAMAMVVFAALGWLIRLRQPPAALHGRWRVSSFRLFFPALNPRAP